MRAGYIQTSPRFGEKQYNLDQVADLARGIQADLIVLPELFVTGYAFTSVEETARLAEPAEGPTCRFLQDLAASANALVVAGFAEEAEGKLFNSSMLVDSGGLIGVYRKLHLFNRENLWFSPGDQTPRVYDAGGFRIGMMIVTKGGSLMLVPFL